MEGFHPQGKGIAPFIVPKPNKRHPDLTQANIQKMNPRIVLPVIDSIRIEGYQLYKSQKNSGVLEHIFVDGINLIVGVNGLGKTTLLRIFHRMLSGPTDLRTSEELGQAQRETKPARAVSRLFADRVNDGAEKAHVVLRFHVARDEVTISRRLDNLKILDFTVGGKSIFSQGLNVEDQYQSWMKEACGFSSFFDFLLCLRYLTFFFEDAKSIVWDPDAQDELTRLFLYPKEDAQSYRVAFNEAQKADSLARNYQNILTKELDALNAAELAQDDSSNEAQDIALAESLKKRLEAAKALQDELEATHRDLIHQLLSGESALLDLQDKISSARQDALEQLFPALEDFGALLVARMQSEDSCIVCGSNDKENISALIDRWATQRICPCCNTEIAVPKVRYASSKVKPSGSHLDALHESRNTTRQAVLSARERLINVRSALALQANTVVEISGELDPVAARVEAAAMRANAVSDTERIASLRRGMLDAQKNRAKHLKTLRETSEKHEKTTARIINKVAREFNSIISTLLAERCELSASIDEMKIGEGASNLRVLAPRFVPMMTSATSPDTMIARRTAEAVSESQRDLIDFAFRLAFLRVNMPKHAASILIDTPERSLDSVFIPRFAKLLANEGTRNTDAPRRFVVTANLTGSPMITKLLNGGGNKKLSSAQKKHILNLLEHAATSAALRRHMREYTENFNKSVRG